MPKPQLLHLKLPQRLRHLLAPTTTLWQVELAVRLIAHHFHQQGIGFILPGLSISPATVLATIRREKLLSPEYLGPAEQQFGNLRQSVDGVAGVMLARFLGENPPIVIRPDIAQRCNIAPRVSEQAQVSLLVTKHSYDDPAVGKREVVIVQRYLGLDLAKLDYAEILRSSHWHPAPADATCRQLVGLIDELAATFAAEAWLKQVTLQLARLAAKELRSTVSPDFSRPQQRNLRRLSKQMPQSCYDW